MLGAVLCIAMQVLARQATWVGALSCLAIGFLYRASDVRVLPGAPGKSLSHPPFRQGPGRARDAWCGLVVPEIARGAGGYATDA